MSNKRRWQQLAGILTEDVDREPSLVGSRIDVKDDDEGRMAKGQLEQIFSQADTLLDLMPDDAQLESWVQSKLTLAAEMIDVVTHYLLDESPVEEQMDAHVEAYEDEMVEEDLDEGKQKGLWDNIHAKRKRGEKPAKPGDADYPDKESWNKVTKESTLEEAEYQGRKVELNKPMRGDVKKFKVYVKNPKGNVVKVNFGDPNMRIKKNNPERRKSFRARHNCDNPGPKHKARYWSCKKW